MGLPHPSSTTPRPLTRALCRLLALAACLTIWLAALWAGPGAEGPRQAQAQPAPAGVQVGLEGARLVDFIRFLGQFMGRPPVFREDQIPPAQVSVVAAEPMAEAEVQELLALVLRPAGLEASLRGGVAYVLPAPRDPGPRGPRLPDAAQILAWRLPGAPQSSGVSPAAVAGVLERLRSEAGQVLFSDQARLVVLADTPARIARLRPVLAALAALPRGQAPDIVPLVSIPARQAARSLDMQLAGQPGAALVLALDWSNSLLLAGTPEALDQARSLAAKADGAGPGTPTLKAYRPRHIRPEKLLGALAELLAKAGGEKSGARLRLDADGHAVLALASPELLAGMDRLVEDLDQPRLRVYIEALVALLPEGTRDRLSLVDGRAQGQAMVGTTVSYRGRVAGAPQLGLEALAALLASEQGVRVLAVPRMAVLDGAEARVSGGADNSGGRPEERPDRAAQTVQAERFRLVLAPRLPSRLDPQANQTDRGRAGPGQVLLRVSLEDLSKPGQTTDAEARLDESQVLLLDGQAGPAAGEAAQGPQWALFSRPRQGDGGQGRLIVLVNARVVRPPAPERAPAPQLPAQRGGQPAKDNN